MLTIGSGHAADYLLGQVGGASDDYYTGAVIDGEPPGQWYGKGAQTLGLDGQVDADVMHAVYDGFADPREVGARLGAAPKQYRTPAQVVEVRVHSYTEECGRAPTPEQVQSWTIEAERKAPRAVMFYDLTYSPPKSVTVLWAAYSRAAHEAERARDTETAERFREYAASIEAAVMRANAVMLDHIEEQVLSRTGRHAGRQGGRATGRWTNVHGFTAAQFLQHDSRDHDPQLHVHNAVLNRVECIDGQWRAVDGKSLYAAKAGASAVASIELRESLSREHGVAWRIREDGNDFEIDGITQEELDRMSSRARTLNATADALIATFEEHHNRAATSYERRVLRQQATLDTRRGKEHSGETGAEMLDRIDAEMRGDIAGGMSRIAHRLDPVRLRAERSVRTPATWSPTVVVAQAIEACHKEGGRATFSEPELRRQIYLALPAGLGLDDHEGRNLVERLAKKALSSGLVVQTAGLEIGHVPDEQRLADGRADTIGPGQVRYAAVGQLAAEQALLRAAGERGRHALDRADVATWLSDESDVSRAALTPAQREAIAGLSSSDAALAVLVGPAGTGKSYTVGRFAEAWEDLSGGGRVVGVATAQVAANILRDDGLQYTHNTAAFLAAQIRLADSPASGDEQLRLGPRDVLVVDEANMLDTSSLTRLQAVASAAGARMVVLGDPHQLGAVGAGGMMRTITGQVVAEGGEVHTLGEVRRFDAEWERDASLRLRDGDADVVTDYDRRGRLIDGGTEAETISKVAHAAAADRLAGHDTVVIAASNVLAADVAAAVRRHLVDAGRVTDTGVILGRDGCAAGVGDVVQARRIDRGLGLTNRETYEAREVLDDGSLVVCSTRTGERIDVPASYVDADLALAYSSTVHAAEGATVNTGHLLLTPGMATSSAYVGLTRGRTSNTAWAVTDSGIRDVPPGTARGMLSDIVDRDADAGEWSALDIEADDQAYRASAATLSALIEDETRIAYRARFDEDLDQLVADGVLSEEDRARFGSDQASEHLSRQLRAVEQAGRDPAAVLRDAVAAHSLNDAHSVAQVVSMRIHRDSGLPEPTESNVPPARIPSVTAEYLDELHKLLDQRRADLGRDLAARSDADDAPAWLPASLGTAPAVDDLDRGEWISRAGTVAAYREATGWESDEVAIGGQPGVHTPERRAAWYAAHGAGGLQEPVRPIEHMTDGQLHVRVAAAERAWANAPAFVDDAMRTRHQQADQARREAVHARATERVEDAAALDRRAAEDADAADQLDQVADDRGAYLAWYAATFDMGDAARDELQRRGHDPGDEADRTNASDWLADDRAAHAADDEHRDVTEADIDQVEDERAAGTRTATDEASDAPPAEPAADNVGTSAGAQPDGRHEHAVFRGRLSAVASAAEVAAAAQHAAAVREELADKSSHDAHESTEEDEWHRHRKAAHDTDEDSRTRGRNDGRSDHAATSVDDSAGLS
jgi:conjugative relaxase-like TrwC/TraI family protein